jgi:hypothetical protein
MCAWLAGVSSDRRGRKAVYRRGMGDFTPRTATYGAGADFREPDRVHVTKVSCAREQPATH